MPMIAAVIVAVVVVVMHIVASRQLYLRRLKLCIGALSAALVLVD
jgi:hypothetical protein